MKNSCIDIIAFTHCSATEHGTHIIDGN